MCRAGPAPGRGRGAACILGASTLSSGRGDPVPGSLQKEKEIGTSVYVPKYVYFGVVGHGAIERRFLSWSCTAPAREFGARRV